MLTALASQLETPLRPLGFRLPSARARAGGLFLAFLLFAGTGIYLRVQDEPPPEPTTIGDVVRPDFVGTLPTPIGLEEWREALAPFDLEWVDDGARQTERPSAMLVFDDEFDSYAIGSRHLGMTELTAAIGFEGDEVAWFACHAFGPTDEFSALFFGTCFYAAAITGVDTAAALDWIATTLATEGEAGRLFSRAEAFCPAVLQATKIHGDAVNAQITIAALPEC